MAGRLIRPPYVEPTTSIVYDTNDPEYEGWLTKQSMWLKVSSVVLELHVGLLSGSSPAYGYHMVPRWCWLLSKVTAIPSGLRRVSAA
mmetsp:Transcript_53314/g.159648  ORF Transcript_53314/g.159648 Transcript_53314/m.159648 type:complete len:87 (-) Transcript_53314:1517-1777(-)